MASDPAAVAARVTALLERLAGCISQRYPHHADALRHEITATNVSWDRIAAIINSLRAVPGVFLQGDEHDQRNRALSCADVARKMALANMPDNRGAADALLSADWRSSELLTEMP